MKRVLSGIRVLDLSRVVAGPFGSMILGDLGAEVIKMEVREGDELRMVAGPRHNGETYYYIAFNRNKKSISLDLGTELGKQAFIDLVKISDVVWDNFRSGVMENLGADYETLKKINPRIICCSITGYGPSGPYRDWPSYDQLVWALSGLLSLTGEPDGPPVKPGPAFGDLNAGMFGAIGVLSALVERERTGVGKKVEVPMLDSSVAMLVQYVPYYFLSGDVPKPLGTGHIAAVPVGAYPTKDGYVVVGPCWPRIARVLGAEWLMDDPRFATRELRLQHRKELDAIIADLFRKEKTEDWLELLHIEDIGAAPLNTVDKTVSDPQVVHSGIIRTLQHVLGGEVKVAGNPIRMPGQAEEKDLSPPLLGQHTDEILRDLLRYSEDRIKRLKEEQEKRAAELDAHLHKVFPKIEQPQSGSPGT